MLRHRLIKMSQEQIQQAIRWYYVERYSIASIAEELGFGASTVNHHVVRKNKEAGEKMAKDSIAAGQMVSKRKINRREVTFDKDVLEKIADFYNPPHKMNFGEIADEMNMIVGDVMYAVEQAGEKGMIVDDETLDEHG